MNSRKLVSTTLLAVALTLACGDGGGTESTDASLDLDITGLPAGIEADVRISGPNGYSTVVTQSVVVTPLTPGRYSLEARPVTGDGFTWLPDPVNRQVRLAEAVEERVVVTYGAEPFPTAVDYEVVQLGEELDLSGEAYGVASREVALVSDSDDREFWYVAGSVTPFSQLPDEVNNRVIDLAKDGTLRAHGTAVTQAGDDATESFAVFYSPDGFEILEGDGGYVFDGNGSGTFVGRAFRSGPLNAYQPVVWTSTGVEVVAMEGYGGGEAVDINEGGEVLIRRTGSFAGDFDVAVFDRSSGDLTGIPGSSGFYATKIGGKNALNDAGQAIIHRVEDNQAAFFDGAGTPSLIPPLADDERFLAYDLTEGGVVGGWSESAGRDRTRPALYRDGVTTDLGSFGGAQGRVRSMKDAVGAVGYSEDEDGNPRAFIHRDDDRGLEALPGLGGAESEALNVASDGTVAGWATDRAGVRRPVLWVLPG